MNRGQTGALENNMNSPMLYTASETQNEQKKPLKKIGTQRAGIIYANYVKLGVVNTVRNLEGKPSFIINIYSALASKSGKMLKISEKHFDPLDEANKYDALLKCQKRNKTRVGN